MLPVTVYSAGTHHGTLLKSFVAISTEVRAGFGTNEGEWTRKVDIKTMVMMIAFI